MLKFNPVAGTLDYYENDSITPDADATTKGKLKLTNDLGGTADLPTVPGLATKQPLDPTLTALAAHNTNGILTQTAADTFTGRTITGTANRVTVTNGNGVAGNPTLSLPQDIHTGASPSFTGINVGGAANLRPFNIKGSGFSARFSIQGTTPDDSPGVEFTNDANANRALIRMDSVSTTGTSLNFWTESISGGIENRLIIGESGNTAPANNKTYTLGTPLLYWKETYTDKLFLNSTATLDGSTAGEIKGTGIFTADNIKRGTGFPNGVVTAPVGSIYIDTAITNGASSWIKKSGTGSTGWKVLDGDTGWRDVSALIPPASTTGGILKIRRVLNRIYIQASNLYLTSTSEIALIADIGSSLGAEWRPIENVSSVISINSSGVNTKFLNIRPTHVTLGLSHVGEITTRYWASAYDVISNWPSTLPGTAA